MARLEPVSLSSSTRATTAVLPDELRYLIAAFIPSSNAGTDSSKAYVILAAYCDGILAAHPPDSGTGKPSAGPEAIAAVFAPLIEGRLRETAENDVLAGISFLTALFQVNWQSASLIFQRDGLLDSVLNCLDDTSSSATVQRAIAQLLSQAAGHKPCRSAFSPRAVVWLEEKSGQTSSQALRAAAAIAIVKLFKGSKADAAAALTTSSSSAELTDAEVDEERSKEGDLASLFKNLVVASQNTDLSTASDAVEGLAYTSSSDPLIKESLSKDKQFLSCLFSLIPRKAPTQSYAAGEVNSALLYGIALIIENLTAYRPRMSEEDSQIEKLRQMAKQGPAAKDGRLHEVEADVLTDDEHVRTRCKRLVATGALDALTSMTRATESAGLRRIVSQALLNIIEDQANRGKALQAGAGKALSLITRGALSSLPTATSSMPSPISSTSAVSNLAVNDLIPIQALAKLAITASPTDVFGPSTGLFYDAIRPFSVMLQHPSAKSLQRFEALMALTNLASQGPEAAERVSKASGLLAQVELILLDDHVMLRRAATELICNLIVGSEAVFERYSGESTDTSKAHNAAKSKLQILTALSDVEDLPTRLAASGALATLSDSPSACRALYALQMEHQRVLPVLVQLIDPSVVPSTLSSSSDDHDDDEIILDTKSLEADPGLVHRGVVCFRNWMTNLGEREAREIARTGKEVGIVVALVGLVQAASTGRGPGEEALRPAAEALQAMMASGVQLG